MNVFLYFFESVFHSSSTSTKMHYLFYPQLVRFPPMLIAYQRSVESLFISCGLHKKTIDVNGLSMINIIFNRHSLRLLWVSQTSDGYIGDQQKTLSFCFNTCSISPRLMAHWHFSSGFHQDGALGCVDSLFFPWPLMSSLAHFGESCKFYPFWSSFFFSHSLM